MNNNKNKTTKQDQNNQRPKTRQEHAPKKQGSNRNVLHAQVKYHDQERPETRMFD